MKVINGLERYQGQRPLRKIDAKTVSPSGQVVFDLPQDVVIKEIIITHDCVVTPTFASGSPKLHQRGVLHGLLSGMEVSRSGNDVIKSFRGLSQIQDQAEYLFGNRPVTLYQTNASAFSGSEVATQDAPLLAATTQPVVIRETVSIPFENKLSSEWVRTCLNLNGINTAKLKMSFGAVAGIQDPTDSTTVSFTYSGTVTVYIATADHLGDVGFDDWRQFYDELVFNAQANRSVAELKPLGELQGMFLRATKGSAANGHYIPMNTEELKNTIIEAKFNDVTLFEGSMADFQAMNACKSSMARFLRAAARIQFLNNSTYGTGLETGQDAKSVTPIRLTISTPSSINHASNPVRIVAEYDVIRKQK